MLKPFRLAASLLLIALLSACANTRVDPGAVPAELIVKPNVTLPLQTAVGLYLTDGALSDSEVFRSQIVQRGRFLREGVDEVTRVFFSEVVHRDRPTDTPVSLMLDLDTKWSVDTGKIKLEIMFRMFDAAGTLLLEGSRFDALPLAADAPDVVIKNIAIKTTQKVMAAIINSKSIDAPRTTTTTVQAFPGGLLLSEKSPYRIGSGAYISKSGDVLASASALLGCLRIDVGSGDTRRTATVVATSPLLNLAVLRTGADAAAPLSLATVKPPLGTAISAMSVIRTKDAETTRNLSFGNVSSHEGVAGAFGAFQFSSATPPKSFGSPLVDADGKLIGVWSNGYPYDTLHRNGQLATNTFQAVTGDVTAAFLKRSGVPYSTADYPTKLTPVERLTESVVAISCYQ